MKPVGFAHSASQAPPPTAASSRQRFRVSSTSEHCSHANSRCGPRSSRGPELRLGVLDKEIMRVERLIREIGAPYRAVNRRDGALPIKSEQQPDGGVAAVQRGDVSIDY